MARSYSADHVIILPRVDTTDAVTLGQELLTSAQTEVQLSSRITKALKRLSATHGELADAAGYASKSPARAEARREADRKVDAGWAMLLDFLNAWSKHPYEPAAAEQARHMRGVLYPEGLKFTLLPFKREWSESETRILHMDREGFGATIAELGGATFVKAIRKAHKVYGEVLGITHVLSETPPSPTLREQLEAFTLALRGYVLQVTAHADDDDPEADKLVERLLSPLAKWQTPVRGQVKQDTSTDSTDAPEEAEPNPDAGGDGASETSAPSNIS